MCILGFDQRVQILTGRKDLARCLGPIELTSVTLDGGQLPVELLTDVHYKGGLDRVFPVRQSVEQLMGAVGGPRGIVPGKPSQIARITAQLRGHPVVGVTETRPAFIAAPGEVEEILEVSIDDLRDASRIRQGVRIREGVAFEYPYFDLLGHQVWGATAMILGEFICLLQDEDQPETDTEPR